MPPIVLRKYIMESLVEKTSQASADAHKHNLTYKGHGYWQDAQGKTVAKTVKDKLQWTNAQSAAPTPAKPVANVTRTPQQHTQPIPNIQSHDAAALTGKLQASNFENFLDPHLNFNRFVHIVPDGQFRVIADTVKKMTNIVANRMITRIRSATPKGTNAPLFGELENTIYQAFAYDIPNQSTYVCSVPVDNNSVTKSHYKDGISAVLDPGNPSYGVDRVSPEIRTEISEREKEWVPTSVKQHTEWRSKLPTDIQRRLIEVSNAWQGNPQTHIPLEKRKSRNAFLDNVIDGTYSNGVPATFHTTNPVERGMGIPIDKINEFMSNIQPGNSMNIPIEGFSMRYHVPREFIDTYNESKASVIMRMYPKESGVMKGLCLSSLQRANITLPESPEYEAFAKQHTLKIYALKETLEELDPLYQKTRLAAFYNADGEPEKMDYMEFSNPDKEFKKAHAKWKDAREATARENGFKSLDDAQEQYRKVSREIDVIEDDISGLTRELEQHPAKAPISNTIEFDPEAEVILPGNTQCRVLKVEKILINDTVPKLAYIIHLQDETPEQPIQNESVNAWKHSRAVFTYFMNTPLHGNT